MMKFLLHAHFSPRGVICSIACSTAKGYADAGVLDFTPAEWQAFKLLVGSGAVQAQATGIECEVIEDD